MEVQLDRAPLLRSSDTDAFPASAFIQARSLGGNANNQLHPDSQSGMDRNRRRDDVAYLASSHVLACDLHLDRYTIWLTYIDQILLYNNIT